MKHLKKLSILALLLIAAVQGAWAADATLLTVTQLNTVPLEWTSNTTTAITANDLPGIKNVEKAVVENWADTNRPTTDKMVLVYGFTTDGKAQYVEWNETATYKEEVVYQSVVANWITNSGYKVYYNSGNYAIAPTKTAGKNEWKIASMPAANLVVQVEYYPAMLTLATNNAEWGTVEVAGMTETTIPEGVETDQDGNIYVEKGTEVTLRAVPAEGYKLVSWSNEAKVNDTGTQTITMTDADLSVTATFAEITYNLTLKAANANTVEAGKATVAIDGTAATPDDKSTIGNLKKGQTVTLTAKEGYKFRSVTAGKTAASKPLSEVSAEDMYKVIAADGMIYGNADAATAAGTEARAVIVYVGSNTENETYKHGLALSLANEGSALFGNASSLCTNKNITAPVPNATWLHGSVNQWNTMINAGGIDKLCECFSPVGGTNISMTYYWTSSSEAGNMGYRLEIWDYGSGWGLGYDFITYEIYYNASYAVRAVLAF